MNGAPRTSLRLQLEALIQSICEDATALQLDGSFVQEIRDAVEQNSYAAPSAEQLLIDAYAPDRRMLLDFGCGAMAHRGFIEGIGYLWHGVDYLPGVAPMIRGQVEALIQQVSFYNGTDLPYAAGRFDVIWAMLTLMHVQHIDRSFAELARVLRPGGRVIGQVSALEQVQDYGTFNYTPIGMKVAAASCGLRLTKIYPKHDAFSFLLRRLAITLGAPDETPFNAMFDPEGFYHRKMIEVGERLGAGIPEINLLRLMFCTHFVFELQAPP